jgi:hypothetical protein
MCHGSTDFIRLPLSFRLGQALKSSNGNIDQVVEDQSFARYKSHVEVCQHIFYKILHTNVQRGP